MKQLVLILALLCLPVSAWAAIDCNDANKAETNSSTPPDPTEFAYTVPTGSNRVTLVGVSLRDVGNDSVPTITGAGSTFVQVGGYVDSGNVHVSLWRMLEATPGATTISLTYSEGILAIGVVVFTCSGVDQGTPFGTPNTAIGTSTAATVTVADDVGDVTVDIVAGDLQTAEPSEGADQTVVHKGKDGANEVSYGMSYQPGDGGVMSWTMSDSASWAILGVALKPAAEASLLQSPPVPPVVLQ